VLFVINLEPHEMLRILHVGLGPLGLRIVDDLYTRRVGQVVAACDMSPAVAGKMLDQVIKASGKQGKGVRVVESLDHVDDWSDIDAAIVATSSDLRACADTFRTLLKRGIAVVTTCEEMTWPWLRHKALAEELDGLCLRRGGRLLGTGVNPGFLMDTVPVFATTACKHVESIEIHRYQDATTRRIPFQKKIGATLDIKAFKDGIKAGWLRHVGLGESLHFVAAAMNWHVDSWKESIEPVKATKAMKCGLGAIKAGHACGVRQTATAMIDGKPRLKFVFQAAIGQKKPAPQDRVIVKGEPDLDLVFQGGVHGDVATSAITINSIPSLRAAPPGLHTMASVPLVHWAPPSSDEQD
jgi:hypothetical protein